MTCWWISWWHFIKNVSFYVSKRQTVLKQISKMFWWLMQRGIPQSRFYHITGQINPGFAVTLGFPFQNEHGMLVTIATYALNQTWSDQVLCRLSLEHNGFGDLKLRSPQSPCVHNGTPCWYRSANYSCNPPGEICKTTAIFGWLFAGEIPILTQIFNI